MKYHHPSFMHYLTQALPDDFGVFHHNWMLHVIPPHAYFTPPLFCEYFTGALIQSVEEPLDAPSGPRQRSLFDAPPVAHCDALADALSVCWENLCYDGVIHTEAGERREYIINLQVVRGILQDVRRAEDVKLATQMLTGEFKMPYRLLLEKVLYTQGRDIGESRAREAMRGLDELGYSKKNGNLRTGGRDVIKWKS